jgi:arylsulfatase A-like enzyme
MLERRRRVRRALGGGAVLGAAAALVLALVEVVYLVVVARGSLPRRADLVRLVLCLPALLLLLGSLLGTALGALGGLVGLAADALARRRGAAPIWSARLYTVVATPAIALVCAQAFQGRRARTIAHKDLVAVGLGLLLCGLFYLAARLATRLRDRIGRGLWGLSASLLVAATMLTAAAALYLGDQRLLPRLYPFLHLSLAACAFLTAELGLGAIYLALRHGRPRVRRLADPWVALLVGVASCAAGLTALPLVGRSETLRFVLFERAALGAKALRVAQTLHALPPRPRRATADVGALDHPAVPLPPGLRVPAADVFLISVDALRADHVGSYGYPRPTTPNLDRVAQEGVVFERAYAQVPHTSFSVATLLTGKYVYSLAALGDAARHETLAEVLRRYRYKTAAFYPPAVFYIDQKKFTTYEASNFGFEYVKFEYLDAQRRVDQIVDFLEAEKPPRVFVWVHFFEPHEPYEVHPGGRSFGSGALDRYDGEIAYVDQAIARLLEYIARTRPRAVVAITADHGEEFGEHGGRYHGTSLYDEQIHVPFILFGPGLPKGRRIHGAVETVDIPVTLLSLVDITPSARMRGTDLTPWLELAPPTEALLPPAFAEIETKKMVVEDGKKLVCDTAADTCALYDLAADPREQRNLIGEQGELFAELRGRLDSWIASHSRLERDTAFQEQTDVARRALERGRLGDRGAVPELGSLLKSGDPAVRRESARLLARLPADPRVRQALTVALADSAAGPWAAVALERFCDPAAHQSLLRSAQSDGDPELEARAGLALAGCGEPAFTHLKAGLAADDITLRRDVVLALGAIRDPRAVPLLMERLEVVLERPHVVRALGRIGAPEVAPVLIRLLHEDPYVNVREEAALALGRVAGRRAVPALLRALDQEREPTVAGAIVSQLHHLGALAGAVDGAAGRVVARRGELWIGVSDGAGRGTLELVEPAASRQRIELREGTAAYRVQVPRGTVEVRVEGPVAYLYAR